MTILKVWKQSPSLSGLKDAGSSQLPTAVSLALNDHVRVYSLPTSAWVKGDLLCHEFRPYRTDKLSSFIVRFNEMWSDWLVLCFPKLHEYSLRITAYSYRYEPVNKPDY